MRIFRAIGFAIFLVTIANLMAPTFQAFQSAAIAAFGTVQVAAHVSQLQLLQYQQR